MSNDYIIKGITTNGMIRFAAATTRDLVEEARSIHDTSPVCTAALGRLLTAGAMMGTFMKGDSDMLTLSIRGDGPAQGLTVTADSAANVKGFIYNTNVELPPRSNGHLDVGGAVGHGTLSVIKDIGLKEPYVGQVDLISGEIAEDITGYYAISEQVPTVTALGVLVGTDITVQCAGGFIIQLMPGHSEEDITRIESGLTRFTSITDELSGGKAPEDIIFEILGPDISIDETVPTAYSCNCSRERAERALISVGKDELLKMRSEDENVNIHCDFCGKDYKFIISDDGSIS